MKEIPLTQGYVALVDDEDHETLSKYDWFVQKGRCTQYAARKMTLSYNKYCTVYMHRLILGLPIGDKRQVDHINHNGLDNRRQNIRIATSQENHFNRRTLAISTSQYKGVSWNRNLKKWKSRITINGKETHIGYFDKEIDAAIAYDKVALNEFKEFALTNFPVKNYIELDLLSIQEIAKNKLEKKTSSFRGVYWYPRSNTWYACICRGYKDIYVGSFESETEAAKAYNEAAIKYHKEKAKLNNIEDRQELH